MIQDGVLNHQIKGPLGSDDCQVFFRMGSFIVELMSEWSLSASMLKDPGGLGIDKY